MDQSSDQDIEKIKVLIQAVKKTKNDSEMFAAILAMSKLLKASDLTQSQRKDIFLAIGFSFPFRLLTSSGDEDCPKPVLNELGLSLLTSFVSDPDLASSSENTKIIPIVIQFMEEKCVEPTKYEQSLNDCFCYLTSVIVTDYNCLTVLKHNGIKILVKAFCSSIGDKSSLMFWSTIHHLINFDADTVWCTNIEHMVFLLEYITEQTCTNFSETKFHLYNDLSLLLEKLPAVNAELYFENKWVQNLCKSLYEVFRSKITSKERNPSLKLSHHLTEIFGLEWTLYNAPKTDKNFAVFLVKLCCVEIRLTIHKWLEEKASITKILDSSDMALFVVCCAMVEAACSSIGDFDSNEDSDGVFTFADIKNLEGSLSETVEDIVESLISVIIDVPELTDLVVCCLRTSGSFLNIEVFAQSKTRPNFVETIYSMFKVSLKSEPAAAIKFATPVFLHYATNVTARDCLLNLDILSCLTTTLTELTIPDETKYLSAQCLCLFCVESNQCNGFDDILPIVMDYSLTLAHDTALCFYINLLALMVWNKRCDTNHRYSQKERFFQNLVRLLHTVHTVYGHTVKLAKPFRDIWNDIEELWFVLVKEFIRASSNDTGVRDYVMQSSLPRKVNDLLSCKKIDSDIADTYHQFNAFVKAGK